MQVILLLYVDDLFLTGDEELIADSKRKLIVEFEMKDLGPMHYFLGLEVWQNSDEIILGQGKYAMEILKRFGMMDCKSMSTPTTTNLKLLGDTSSGTIDATGSLGGSKTCSQVSEGNNRLWPTICKGLQIRLGWLYRFRLGR
jgi:hypothetical protein